jgi:hypothetical protein
MYGVRNVCMCAAVSRMKQDDKHKQEHQRPANPGNHAVYLLPIHPIPPLHGVTVITIGALMGS